METPRSKLQRSSLRLNFPWRNAGALAGAVFRWCAPFFLLLGGSAAAKANVPGAIVSGSNPPVTLTDGGSTVTMSNGIVSILCTKSSETITQINYTYNNGSGTTTTQLLNGGFDGGKLYWEFGGFGGNAATYSIVVNPATGDTTHGAGNYAEIDLLSTSSGAGTVDIHFSMLRGSPGFYVTAIWNHGASDAAIGLGETRTNIYSGGIFNWMSVDPGRNKLMEVSNSATSVPVPGAPVECYLWTNGIYQGHYEDKYKYSADFSDEQYIPGHGPHRVWGWSSVGTGGYNVGLWDVDASQEYYNGGPMKRELMSHIGTTILNMFNGDHYAISLDGSFAAGELWNKVYGPYFVYCNNVANTVTDPVQASQSLYGDAVAQGAAETSGTASTTGTSVGATAWPYGWFVNSSYAAPSGRGTVTGQIVVSDSGNPNASGSNMFVGVVQQPLTSASVYDFQNWMKPYQFWVQADANGNFTIPNVIAGTNYTLYAFGPGAEDEFMSQNQTGGKPPILFNLPATPFSVPVTGGSTTKLGTITWTPTRVGATVFEIGYPDRTARKFRHGDDFWVGDIGSTPTSPAPVWNKFLEYPFDFPNGMTYNVGSSRWATDWDYVQPVVTNAAGTYTNSTGTIKFNLASAPSASGSASLYIGLASNDGDATLVTVNGHNLGSTTGVTSSPNTNGSGGYGSPYASDDTTIREGSNGQFTDERMTFPASLLTAGTNTITITMEGAAYFADHIMYDYIRLELAGYVPPAPAGVAAYSGASSMLLSWPVTPGATSYNIGRSTTTGSNYSAIATGVVGPACGSGYNNAAWVDTTATNGTTYYYVVQSVNSTGTSANSAQSAGVAPSSAGPTSPPAAPSGLVATPGNGQVSLSWTAPAQANYYTVQRSVLYNNGGTILSGSVTAAETYNNLGTIALTNTTTGTTYTDFSPTNGSTYAYTVTAANASGTGGTSTAANAVPLAAAPTATPVLTVTPGTGQATLNWTPVPGAVGYVIEVATSPGGPYTLIASVTELTYVDTGLTTGVTYYYTVQATNSGGSSATSAVASSNAVLSPPASLTAVPGNTQITLNWPAVVGATGYSVQRSATTGGPYTQVGTSGGTSFTDNGLTNGIAYFYVVATTNADGTGTNSAQATATPIATVPVAPTGLNATPGNAQVILNWTASVSATSYVVREATNSGGPYTTLSSTVAGTTYTASGLANGTTYYYVIAAASAGGTGANSSEANATPSVNASNLIWTGGISTFWDAVTANWSLSGNASEYVDGNSVTFNDTAATSTVVITAAYNPGAVIFNNSILNYSLSGTNGGSISGVTGLVKTGTGSLTLAGANAFTGSTVIDGGTLILANTQALQDSTLNYNNEGGTLNFGALTSCTFGGLSGGETLSLTNTGGSGVALAVGNNGQNSAYTGGLSGSGGSLTKISTGTLILSGSSSYAGATVTTGGVLSISTGAVINGSTANITAGQLQINGGTLTSGVTSNITAGSGGLLVSSGTASFNGGLTSDAGVDTNIFVGVAGGVLNMASLYLGRTGTIYTSQPAAGSTTSGLYVSGGTATISGALNICTSGASNSSDSVRIDSGALTVDSTTTITLNNGSRWSVLDVNGGTFTSNDSTGAGIELGGVFGGENGLLLVRNGTANTDKITFGDGNQTSGSDVVSVTGGVLYIGSGGMVLGGAGSYTSSVSLTGTGTLGALADWSSPINITLGGDTIQAGDAFGTGHNIALSGNLTGTTLTKTGNGMLVLAGACSYTGATSVGAGVLEITGTVASTNSLVIASGATCYLAGGSITVSGTITNNGIFKVSGTPALALTGSFTNNGVLDLINGASTLPPNFVNHGTVLNAGSVQVQQLAMGGPGFTLTIQGYAQHTYQLQNTPSLAAPITWTNVGAAQAGTGAPLNFTDAGASGKNGFYRVLVSP
jgi:rhamnogalacturonan endolyase